MDLKSIAEAYQSVQEKKLDPVGKEDGDVDNDGDKDSSDSYLMKRRAAIKKAMKKEEVELTEAPSPNQAAIDAFLKRGGKVKKVEPGTGKEGEKQMKGFKKSFDHSLRTQLPIMGVCAMQYFIEKK